MMKNIPFVLTLLAKDCLASPALYPRGKVDERKIFYRKVPFIGHCKEALASCRFSNLRLSHTGSCGVGLLNFGTLMLDTADITESIEGPFVRFETDFPDGFCRFVGAEVEVGVAGEVAVVGGLLAAKHTSQPATTLGLNGSKSALCTED